MKNWNGWMMRSEDCLENSSLLLSLRQGLAMGIPFVLTGSFALVLKSFPAPVYQNFLQNLWGGSLYAVLDILSNCTLGILGIVLMLSVCYCYGKRADAEKAALYPIVALTAYFGLTGGTVSFEMLGSTWLFTALFVGLLACKLFDWTQKIWKKRIRHYTQGTDYFFNLVTECIIPAAFVTFAAVLLSMLLNRLLGSVDLKNICSEAFTGLFGRLGQNFASGFLYVFLVQIFWFFGIHGSNLLDAVAKDVFEPGVAMNAAALGAGQAPHEIFTKTFFDHFVTMGGSGAALCLVLALFLVSRKRGDQRLAKMGLVPVLFNVNELIMFGLPVIFNLSILIPFLLVPMLFTAVSGTAMALGWVPLTQYNVEWTTPAVLSGYFATGSVAGSILQIVNIALGVLIYIPFIRRNERRQRTRVRQQVSKLERQVQEGELAGNIPSLIDERTEYAAVAKMLANDLKYAMEQEQLALHYQPQIYADGSVYGVEALLRWKHPEIGNMYPPLLITLAQQSGYLDQLGFWVIERAFQDYNRLCEAAGQKLHLSVNLAVKQLENQRFAEEVARLMKQYAVAPEKIGFELTEQSAFLPSVYTQEQVEQLSALGLHMIIDDFGMGHSSLLHMQSSDFSMVKLDGSLVKQLRTNQRSREIISSITQLADSLHFDVLAEYVETKEEQKLLEELGCRIYQGYFYAKAMPVEQAEEFLRKTKKPQ